MDKIYLRVGSQSIYSKEVKKGGRDKEKGCYEHVEQIDDLVCVDKGQHFRVDLFLNVESSKGKDGHWTRLEVVSASDAYVVRRGA